MTFARLADLLVNWTAYKAEHLLMGECCRTCLCQSSRPASGRIRCVYDRRGQRHRLSYWCERYTPFPRNSGDLKLT
jgi:hypothetical protein